MVAPKNTILFAATGANPVPVIVTVVPTGPLAGLNELIIGAWAKMVCANTRLNRSRRPFRVVFMYKVRLFIRFGYLDGVNRYILFVKIGVFWGFVENSPQAGQAVKIIVGKVNFFIVNVINSIA